jgi:mono/diheme cytochrome c family protein
MRAAILALAFLSVLAMALAQNVNYRPDSGWQPPADAVNRPNPLANQPQAAAGGRKLFVRNCAQCHGESGQGLKKAADLRLPVVRNQSDGTLFWKITNGNPAHGMPPWSRLPESQRWQIVLFLRTLSPEPQSSQ